MQGLGNLDTLLSLRKLLRRVAPSLVFLSKTRLAIASAKVEAIKYKVGFPYGVHVDSVGRS